jgi:hypothetical protein
MHMSKLPDDVQAQLRQMITERLPAKKIAFMLRLSRETVEAAIREETEAHRVKDATRLRGTDVPNVGRATRKAAHCWAA